MTDAAIIATTLRTIRKARKLGRPRLARMAGLSERQLSKLEGAKADPNLLQSGMISKLATALAVPEAVLSGEMPLSDADLTPMADTKCKSGCCG